MEKLYLGRRFDPASGQTTPEDTLYDPADLTTHAVVTGMTGSGKTGLCIALMEEAALQGIPAIIIDPKGDLTNLLLHFPDLSPQDFMPWLDADTVRRRGQSLEQAAAQTAQTWRSGLEDWGIAPERIRALQNAAHFAVYTPGSDVGLRVSVLSTLQAPNLPWEGNREILREKIASTVTALLSLAGLDDVDPVRSREHILLANIFEQAWSQGRPLDLTELILQTQQPPFDRLGAFPLESFFPAKERTALAMLLNNILASPAFETWREGQPLEIPGFLHAPDGKPCHSIFYLAHLSESERMFFVTLLISSLETWMRTQPGSQSLRAILYFDELYGYLPPQRNPASKTPLLRLLKQARAFGVGLLLATQNPVDVDYKALSNAGTWFVGKLQTERDKERLLDGLESAAAGLDRATYGRIISGLGKRAFLLHNVHASAAQLFQTRWVMNYLAGPLTRAQIPALNRLRSDSPTAMPASLGPLSFGLMADSTPQPPPPQSLAELQPVNVAVAAPARSNQPQEGTLTKPLAPSGVAEYFLPHNLSLPQAFRAAGEPLTPNARLAATRYHPALLAVARVRLLDRRYGVDSTLTRTALVHAPDPRGLARWEDHQQPGLPLDQIERTPVPQARFAALLPPFSETRTMTAMQRDFADWAYRTSSIMARANTALKVYAGPDVSPAEFRTACAEAARAGRDAEAAKVAAQFERKKLQVSDRLERERRELRQDEAELSQRKWEEGAMHVENITGLFGANRSTRRLSTSLLKRRQTEQAKAEVDESIEAIRQFEDQLRDLEQQHAQAVQAITDRWADLVNDITEVTVTPKKTDIFLQYFGLAWAPFYVIETDGETFELPAFGMV